MTRGLNMRRVLVLFMAVLVSNCVAGQLDDSDEIDQYSAIKPSWTLPVITIQTTHNDSILSKEQYIPAVLSYYKSDKTKVGSYEISIKGRGNHTWRDFEKKPYKIKFNKKIDLVGGAKSKHFALLAFCGSWAYWNNLVGFEISRRVGLEWTPLMKPVELILNGDYQGLYFIVENIRVEEGRVAIKEQKNGDNDAYNATGGWLLEIDNYSTSNQVQINEGEGWYPIWITYHSPDSLSEAQLNYITDYIHKVNDAVKNYPSAPEEWEKYIDIDELTKFYIVQEIMENPEAFCGSSWMHKERGYDEKIKFGPVWDLEAGFYYREEPDFIINVVVEGIQYKQRWITEIIDSPKLQDSIKKKWNEVKGLTNINEFVTNNYNLIKDAILCDHERWPQYSDSYSEESYNIFMERYYKKNEFLHEHWDDGLSSSLVGKEDSRIKVSSREVEIEDGVDIISSVDIIRMNGIRRHLTRIANNRFSLGQEKGVVYLQFFKKSKLYSRLIVIPEI